MQHINRWMVVALVIGGLQLTACQRHHSDHHAEHPAEVEHVPGSDLSKVTFTEKAVERLGVETDRVRQEGGQTLVPYSSLIYDPNGQTWIYTSSAPRSFLRHKVEVDRISGEWAYLSDGPPAGTTIATVAVAEIYGTEFEVGH